MVNNPRQSVSATRGSNTNYRNYIRNSRWNGPAGAEPIVADGVTARFRVQPNRDGSDWRVKIKLPSVGNFRTSPLLQPFEYTDYSMVFPLTPTISMVSSANYDEITHVHTNYPFPQFTNSRVEDITISGEFPVQNEEDGRYWVAATHFLRSVTKMAYGETSNKGAPPPICKLNGYGDFVLNNVPIVITSFTSDVPNNVDYIRVPIYTESNGILETRYSMVPTNSMISITCKVIYSRKKVETFSLDKFVNGDLIDKGFL